MKNRAAKLKSKRRGTENAFGCDLTEHLQSSGQDVPHVLRTCAEFIEQHGIVDGIYRLSGITSNIQRLRQEFCSDLCPDLTKEVYLQDIHCVGSLCKLYFRELPNPLLTYELYKKFTDALSVKEEHEQLRNIQSVIKELPASHFRTLEYLTKHLTHLATLSHHTNMHARNLALVWAPNLLRSREVEVATCNGDTAFLEVRVQQSIVEFILNHTEQIFDQENHTSRPREGSGVEKYATLPGSVQCGPMKLMSLEEAQARSLGPNHPVMKERHRENSLPDSSTAAMYHTVIDLSDSRRKFSGKSKKWRSIFSLGRSVTEKGKLSRNGSVFMRAQHSPEKPAIRPSKSMDSLCASPADELSTGGNGVFVPAVKSRTLDSELHYNLSDKEPAWLSGGQWAPGAAHISSASHSLSALQKTLPEQLKVFKGEENRRMLYSGAGSNGASRPSFPGSLFPLESSPRHQRKALNISEPFAVSVPLRVSAVISSNSTPCRAPGKERDRLVHPGRNSDAAFRIPLSSSSAAGNFAFSDWEAGLGGHTRGTEREHPLSGSRCSIYSNSSSLPVEREGDRDATDAIARGTTESADAEVRVLVEKFEGSSESKTMGIQEQSRSSSVALEQDTTSRNTVIVKDPQDTETSKLEEQVKHRETKDGNMVKRSASQRRSSLPSKVTPNKDVEHSLDRPGAPQAKPFPERLLSCDGGWNYLESRVKEKEKAGMMSHCLTSENLELSSFSQLKETDILQDADPCAEGLRADANHTPQPEIQAPLQLDSSMDVHGSHGHYRKDQKASGELDLVDGIKGSLERLSTCLKEQHLTFARVDAWASNLSGLDQVEPWEDLFPAPHWVTSPLHSPVFKVHQPSKVLDGPEETTGEEADTPSSPKHIFCGREVPSKNQPEGRDTSGLFDGENFKWLGDPKIRFFNAHFNPEDTARLHNPTKAKQKCSQSQRLSRQTSQSPIPKLRPCSLNLDLEPKDLTKIPYLKSAKQCKTQDWGTAEAQHGDSCLELEMFLCGSKAPLRRNSAPVSVSSVRTAFMIKTCQAKAVPVIPPKVQYSHIPHSLPDEPQTKPKKMLTKPAKVDQKVPNPKEDKQRSEPPTLRGSYNPTYVPEFPVLRRKRSANGDSFMDRPRPERSTLLQRSSFRNRPRPQSLILFSPPFPIMDYPNLGDDGKVLLSPIQSKGSAYDQPSEESPGSVTLRNKMTLPKSGQRLETSTSCFYQPQRRSMIFDNRSNRQIE